MQDPKSELSFWMTPYIDLCHKIMNDGEAVVDRTGVGTHTLNTPDVLRFNLRHGMPYLPYKKMPPISTLDELLWFLRGDNTVAGLGKSAAASWWAPHQRPGEEDLGPIYGKQWRAAPGASPEGTDQLKNVLTSLRAHVYGNHPSRRHVVSLWGVGQQHQMALPCCHGTVIQFFVTTERNHDDTKERYLDMTMYQRSADVALGLPVNILSYAILLQLMAEWIGIKPRMLNIVLGDAHIYMNHIITMRRFLADAEELMLKGYPGRSVKLKIEHPRAVDPCSGDVPDVDQYTSGMFKLSNLDVVSDKKYEFPHNV
jgi:thymidylate synthase